MTKLGIIGAMAVEVELLKEKMENMTVTSQAGMAFFDGVLEGLPCVVVQCGVGKVNAALCAQILCSVYGVSHIVNTGIAGSLCAQLGISRSLMTDLKMGRKKTFRYVWCKGLRL